MQRVIVLQARLNSSRLPGKVLLPLAGRPALWHILERLKRCRTIDRMCVATTDDLLDDKLAEYCGELGVDIVRGSENDVLSRYIVAAYHTGADVIVRATADNPLISSEFIDREVEYLDLHPDCDYVCARKLPLGTMSEAFRLKTLEKLDFVAKEEIYREHVTYYLHDKKGYHGFTMAEVEVERELARPELRLTMDTVEDYELLSKIYDELYVEGEVIAVQDVIRFLDENPNVASINQGVIQVPAIAVLQEAV